MLPWCILGDTTHWNVESRRFHAHFRRHSIRIGFISDQRHKWGLTSRPIDEYRRQEAGRESILADVYLFAFLVLSLELG